jgi:hypothetical protein
MKKLGAFTGLIISASVSLADNHSYNALIDAMLESHGSSVIAESNGKRTLFVGNWVTSLESIRSHCEATGGYFKIGKKGYEKIHALESASELKKLYEGYAIKSMKIPEGFAQCRYSGEEILDIDASQGDDTYMVRHPYDGNEDSRLFAGRLERTEMLIGQFVESAKTCDDKRGRGVVYAAGEIVEHDLFIENIYGGFIKPSGLAEVKYLCADTHKEDETFSAGFGGKGVVYASLDPKILKKEVRKTPEFKPTMADPEKKRQSTWYHTDARYKGELKAVTPVFLSKNTQISSDAGKNYIAIYMGNSGSCELAAVQSGYVAPLNMKQLYSGDKQIVNTENFKKCGETVSYVGESIDFTVPKQLFPTIDATLDLCKINGQTSTAYQGYTVACSTRGNDTDRSYEFVIHRKQKLVAHFYGK